MDRIWGATPIEDLPKYKDLYTFTPYIKAAVDVTVNLASATALSSTAETTPSASGSRIGLTNRTSCRPCGSLRRTCWFSETLSWRSAETKPAGEVTWLKPLDPVHVGVRHNEYGDIFGYIQLLTFHPWFLRLRTWCISAGERKAGGTSAATAQVCLGLCLKMQALLDQLEDDLAVICHTYSKPMLVVKAGTPERPFSDAQLQSLMEAFRDRKPATDVFVRGDVAVDVIPSLTKDVNIQFWLDYLYKQREAVLGVPKIFLGESQSTNRATAEVVMQEYVTRLRMLQEIIGGILETVLFKQLIKYEFGEGVEIPKIQWRPIWEATVEDKSRFVSDLVQNGIITVSEARMQLGYPAQPEDRGVPLLVPKPKSEGQKIAEQTVKGVVEQLTRGRQGANDMPGLEEGTTVWRYRVADPDKFEKFRVKELGGGVKITLGKVKGTNRWEIQNYMFEKSVFKDAQSVRKWLDGHLKAEIKTLLDFKAWNEYRRRLVNAYMQISNVE